MTYYLFSETGLYEIIATPDQFIQGLIEEVTLDDELELHIIFEYQYYMYLFHLEALMDGDKEYTINDLSACYDTILLIGEHIFGCAKITENKLDLLDEKFTKNE